MGNRGTLTEYHLHFAIDIVFCIDVTKGMDNVLEKLPTFLSLVPEFINQELLKENRATNQIRMRVIAFSDSQENAQIINASEFCTVLPATNSSTLTAFVNDLRINGEGDTPKSALEALDEAMKSDWVQEEGKSGESLRHVIVLLTDGSINTVGEYSRELTELEKRWGTDSHDDHAVMHPDRRILILLAPDIHPWPTIGDGWAKTAWLPVKVGEGLAEIYDFDFVSEGKAFVSLVRINA